MLTSPVQLVLLVLEAEYCRAILSVALAILVALAGAASILLLLKVASASLHAEQALLLSADWCDTLPAARYHPMLWLLSDRRLRILRSRGALGRELRIRIRRRRIFRRYLKSLRTDFARTCLVVKLIMLISPVDRPDLASRLVRAEIGFSWRLLIVRFRLWKYRWLLA